MTRLRQNTIARVVATHSTGQSLRRHAIVCIHAKKNQIGFSKNSVVLVLHLINTSTDTMFIFSIDNHELQVISTDFVPIHPYKTTSLRIGIGEFQSIHDQHKLALILDKARDTMS